MSNETAKYNDQPASERSCPDPAGSINRRRELFMILEDLGPIGSDGNMATDYFQWMGDKIKEALKVEGAGVREAGSGSLREPIIYDHDRFDEWLESLVEYGDNQFL